MIEFRVVTVTNDLERNAECYNDTEEFPQCVPYVEDEVETFVVGNDDFWPAREFFDMVDVTRFMVDSSEAPNAQ